MSDLVEEVKKEAHRQVAHWLVALAVTAGGALWAWVSQSGDLPTEPTTQTRPAIQQPVQAEPTFSMVADQAPSLVEKREPQSVGTCKRIGLMVPDIPDCGSLAFRDTHGVCEVQVEHAGMPNPTDGIRLYCLTLHLKSLRENSSKGTGS